MRFHLPRLFTPTPRRASDLARSALGVGGGVLAVGLAARLIGREPLTALAIAPPIVASAVVVFAIPASPLAQPRAVIGGNILSALVGLACALAVPYPLLAGPTAAGLAVLAMLLTGTLHPPAAAVAFTAAAAQGALDWDHAIAPIGLGSALLCLIGAAYAPLVGRVYPHPPPADLPPPEPEAARPGASPAGIAATCGAVMSPGLFSVTPQMDAEAALKVLTDHALRTIPVIDDAGRVLGVVRRAELVLEIEREMTEGAGAGRRVGQLLDPDVRTVGEAARIAEALPWLADGADEVVVVDSAGRAVGVLTPADALRALWRASPAP